MVGELTGPESPARPSVAPMGRPHANGLLRQFTSIRAYFAGFYPPLSLCITIFNDLQRAGGRYAACLIIYFEILRIYATTLVHEEMSHVGPIVG